MDKLRNDFRQSRKVLQERYNIRIDKLWGGGIRFNTYDLINFLDREKGSGLTRLRKLSVLMNMDGLGMVDYDADISVNKWAMENEELFSELYLVDKDRICSGDAGIYVNSYGKTRPLTDDEWSYCEAEYPEDEVKRCKEYGDDMVWFWVGEY